MKLVLGMTTNSERREALEELPTDLHNSFRDIITRIRGSLSASQAKLGLQVLMWLHFAHRPLKLVELQHALSVRKTHTELDAENIPAPKLLLSCCLGLVIVDEETSTVRFVHYTLEEYFRKHALEEFPDGCSSIAETCLTYLNFGKLRQHCIDLDTLKKNMNQYAFLKYAARYWGTYYIKQQSSDSLTKLARMIVEHEPERPPCAIQVLYEEFKKPWQWYSTDREIIAQKFSGIHVTAYFGLSKIMACFREVELKTISRQTPLSLAAEYGQEAVVRLLIKRDGVDINTKDNEEKTPLIWAAENGHEAVVQLLIEEDGIDINAKDNEEKTPLIWAALRGHEAVVRLLIERDGIDINDKDNEETTPLIWAALQGHEAVVRLLIERDGIDINAKDDTERTPLIWAAKNGHEVVVQLLIERGGIDINAKDNEGKTPFIYAAQNGHKGVVRLLDNRRDCYNLHKVQLERVRDMRK